MAKSDQSFSKSMRLLRSSSVVAIITSMALGSIANAQVFEDEVVVTAQKRAENIQDVGISVTALSGDQLEALGYSNAQQITDLTPGVHTVQPNGEANYSLAIRGAANSDLVTNQESPVSVYVDEVYISQGSGTGFMLFDTERVEILRGPQGTLFGRNATGGLAHYITKKPTQEYEGYGKFTIGSYGQIKTEGAVSGPLSNAISARVSVSTHQNDGYVENRFTGENINNANDVAARAQLLIEPNDNLSVLLNVRGGKQDIRTGFFENVYSEVDPNSPEGFGILLPGQGIDAFGYADPDNNTDVYSGEYDRDGGNKLETFGLSGTLKYDFDNGMKLVSITDYQTTKRDYVEDTDAGTLDGYNFFLNTDAKQFSQEVRLEGSQDRLQWVVGAYYLDIGIKDTNGAEVPFYNLPEVFDLPLGPNGEIFGIFNPYTTDKESISVFGQVEYDLTDQITAIGGLRYIQDEVDHFFAPDYVFFPGPIAQRGESTRITNTNSYILGIEDFILFPDGNPVASYTGAYDEGLWAGRAQLNFKPAGSDHLFYASYNRGVKGGGFNAPLDLEQTLNQTERGQLDSTIMDFQEEIVDAFELGAKLRLGNAIRLNASVYYNDYENYQAFNINGLDTRTTDSVAESKGFEVELQASPGHGIDAAFGLAYNDTDVTVPPIFSLDGTREVTSSYTSTPVQSPKWNVNGLLRKAFEVGNGELAVQGDFVHRSEHYFNLNGGQGAEASTEDGYTLFNARVSYAPDDTPWELAAFVNNLTDEEYLVQTFDLASVGFGFTEQYYGRPRWWGASIKYNFGG